MKRPPNEFNHIPHAKALGFELVNSEPNRCRLRVPYDAHLVGDPDTGVIHGGVITAALDNASGFAVRLNKTVGEVSSMATLDLRIDYMRPARPEQDLYVLADCFRATSSIAFVRAHAYHDDESDPVATSTAAFMFTRGTSEPEPSEPTSETGQT